MHHICRDAGFPCTVGTPLRFSEDGRIGACNFAAVEDVVKLHFLWLSSNRASGRSRCFAAEEIIQVLLGSSF